MLYPRIERKSLALLLICLVLTLATVGVMFVIYFFYTQENSLIVKPISNRLYSSSSSSNININSNSAISSDTSHHRHHSNHQTQSQVKHEQYHQQQQKEEHSDVLRPNNNAMYSTVNSNNRHRLLAKPVSNLLRNQPLPDRNDYRRQHNGHDQNNRRHLTDDDTTHEIEINDDTYNSNTNLNTNSDTIYIDDYDRLLDNAKTASRNGADSSQQSLTDRLDINNIDYFETIIMDHKKSHQQKPTSNRKRGSSRAKQLLSPSTIRNGASKQSVSASSPTNQINNTDNSIIYKMNKIGSKRWKSAVAANHMKPNELAESSDELLDNETIGSGSGDFIDEEEDDDDSDLMDNDGPFERNTEQYNPSENFYSVSSEFISNLSNQTTTISTRNLSVYLSPMFTQSPPSLPQSQHRINFLDSQSSLSSSSSSNGSNSKKWIPPSIVSSRELLITTTTTTTAIKSNSNLPPNFQRSTTSAGNQPDDSLTAVNNNYQQMQQQQQNQEQQLHSHHQNSGAWLETRARRIMGNVKKSEERSRQLLLCAEAGGGELCRMLFKGHLNE